MATVVFEQSPHAILALISDGVVADGDWDAFLAAIRSAIAAGMPERSLVISEGGAPSPSQRKRLDDAVAPLGRRLKVAIVTRSTFVRGVVNAFALAKPGYRAFAPERMDDAITYLDVRPSGAVEINAAVMRLRVRLRQP